MHINYWEGVKNNRLGIIGLILLSGFIFIGVFSPVIIPKDPLEQTAKAFSPPSNQHWLGTNDVGQDIFSQLLVGARISLLVATFVGGLATFFSLIIGATAGFLGGVWDQVLMRFTDALLAIPPILLMVIAGAYLEPGVSTLIFLLAVFSWPGGARVIRAQTLSLKNKWHVSAAKCFGAGPFYILKTHIIPDLGPLLVALLLQTGRRAVVMEVGLSFLGITDSMVMSWGKMIHYGLKYIYLDVWLWWLLPVGISLSLVMLAFAFLGYALEETMDPRLGRKNGA